MENNLPQGWAEIELSEITDYKKGKKPQKMQPTPFEGSLVYLDIKAIEKGNDEIFVDSESSNYTDENDLIVVWDGARAGWVAKSRVGAIGSTIMSLTPKIDKDFLLRHLQTQFNYIHSNHRGTGIPHVDPDIFWNIKIPIAPLAEQHRIVVKLDAVMQKVESNKQRLDKIPKLLKRFRQSVLAAAVSGKLTEDWRKKKGIIDEWEITKARNICHFITKGTTPKGHELTPTGDIPFLKVYNIVEQKINFDYKPQFVSSDIHNNILKRSKVFPGDIIMNIVGPPLGKIAIITNQYPEWNLNQALAIFRPKERLISEFMYLILLEGSPISQIEKEFRGTAGQSNISLEQCRDFDFPIPDIKEQKEIVRRVDQLFAFADKIEARYTKARAMLDKLPQSILAKAFRGELVPQDPNDEPARVLLERIKAEKEKSAKEKKDKRSKLFKKRN